MTASAFAERGALIGPEIEARVRDVLVATIELDGDEPAAEITRERCPGWSSLRHLVLMTELEETFATTLTMDEMVSMTSFEAILAVVRRHLRQEPATGSSAAAPIALGLPVREPDPAVSAAPKVEPDYRSPQFSLRKLLLWLNGSWQWRGRRRVGRWVRVSGRLHLTNQGELVLGDRVQIHSHFARTVIATTPGGRMEIGQGTIVNYGSDLCATGLVRVGRNCLLGTHTIILDNDFHDLGDRERVPEPRPVILEDRVWLGNRVTVLPGVTIGGGSVISAGSVVMSDIPAGVLAAGNPARVVQKLSS